MLKHLKQQFLQPPDEFTPIPFWFWNDQLEPSELIRQIHDFKSKGVLGFVIHPRLGLSKSIPYLSETYMDLVELVVQEAHQHGMIVYLYDEAMYPSGSAMGQVVKENPEFASRGLKMVELDCPESIDMPITLESDERLVSVQAVRKESDGELLLDQSIILSPEEGTLSFNKPNAEQWSILLFIETFSRGVIRGVYFGQDDMDPDAPPSADLLNPEATDTFIRLTHEVYYKRLHRYFGNTIRGFFTDEPNILGRGSSPSLIPWTINFLDELTKADFTETDLPALWKSAGQRTVRIRRQYEKTINRKLASSYYKPLSIWCENHGIELTGHPSASDDIGLLEYFHLPGQDIVWRYVEPVDGKIIDGADSTLAKCASDAARHRGLDRNVVECFGACGQPDADWHFTGDDMKWYMDWLFVRGTNMFMPHAFYYSIAGERLYERPPDVGPHNIWWPYYSHISDYMKRLSWLMTGGVNQTKIAVLCQADHLPWKIVKPLYENQIEFNYLEESLWTENVTLQQGTAHIKQQRYNTILVEHIDHFEQSTIDKLQQFVDQGGKVLVNDEAHTSSTEQIIPLIDSHMERDITITPANSTIRVTHICKENVHFYFIVNEGEERYEGTMQLSVKGKVEKWLPWEATIEEYGVCATNNNQIELTLERRASIIICVDPSKSPIFLRKPTRSQAEERTITLKNWITTGFDRNTSYPASLTSWTEWPGGEHYSGTVKYDASFELTEMDCEAQISLDLGEVHELATVQLNGIDLGVTMWGPYRYDSIQHAVKIGTNEVSIHVSNSLANKYNQVSLPSGLLGPVTIKLKNKLV